MIMEGSTLKVRQVATVQGELTPPSDKSLTHRAYMLASIADGPCIVRSPLESEDCEATLACLHQLGAVESTQEGRSEVGLIPRPWRQPTGLLNCGNSGTTMRLLAGLLATRPFDVTMIGDDSLSRRPMKRIAEPLRLMGATVEGDIPPLRIKGGKLSGIRYRTPVASAQIKSCILLAGLGAEGETYVAEPARTRDHTERMLSALGVELLLDDDFIGVRGGTLPKAFEFTVPGDISSAAFFMVAAAIMTDAELMFHEIGVNPTRTGIMDVLEEAGVGLSQTHAKSELGEPVAAIQVWSKGVPSAFEIGGALVPRLIDEIPALTVLATQCDGTTVIRDASELRVKESDRIDVMARGLRRMGAQVEPTDDGMRISGPTKLEGAKVDAQGDHRIAMAFAIAGLLARGETLIEGGDTIRTSYPGFEEDLWKVAVV